MVTPRLLAVNWHSSVDEPRATELESTLASCCHVTIRMNWVLSGFSFSRFDAIHLSISAIQAEKFVTTDEASSVPVEQERERERERESERETSEFKFTRMGKYYVATQYTVAALFLIYSLLNDER